MKYAVSMNFLRNGSAAENKAAQRELLDLYAKWKPPEGTTFHQFVSRIDGKGSFAVIETDNPADILDTAAKFGSWVEYEVHPVVEVADAVRSAQEASAFLDASSG